MSSLYKYKGLAKVTGLVKRTGLLIGKGLIRVYELFSGDYQWVFTGKPSEIITKGGLWYAKNFGTGSSDVDVQIKNTQVLTLDGIGSYVTYPNTTYGTSLVHKFKCESLSAVSNTILALQIDDLILESRFLNTRVFGVVQRSPSVIVESSAIIAEATAYDFEITYNFSTGVIDYTVNEVSGQFTGFAIPSNPINIVSQIGKRFGGSEYLEGCIHNHTIEIDSIEKINSNFQRGGGVQIDDVSGNGNHGTLIGAVLSEAWGTKSEYAYPALLANGGSKPLVCEVAGTTSILAAPDGSNVGSEEVVNGGFDTDSDWDKQAAWTIGSGIASCNFTATGARLAQQLSVQSGKIYEIKVDCISTAQQVRVQFNAASATSDTGADVVALISEVGSYTYYVECTLNNCFFQLRAANIGTSSWDNVSVKEVTAISLLDNFKFKLKPTICYTYYLDSINITSGDGYMIKTTPTAITLYRIDAGALTQLDTAVIAYVDYSDIEPTFTGSGITVDVDGVEELSSPDTTYSTFKFVVLDNDAADVFSHFTKDGVKYDTSKFIDGTGTYGVQYAIGVGGGLDADGNELEYPPNKGIWPTPNTYMQPSGDAGLFALSQAYSSLNFQYTDVDTPNDGTFDDYNAIDIVGDSIPEDDFVITNKQDDLFIKNMASEPFQYYQVTEGAYKTIENNYTVIKNF